MYQDDASARSNILEALSALEDFNQQNPNTMIEQFFVQGKSQEYVGIFKKSSPEERSQACEYSLHLMFQTQANYKQQLQ